MDILPDGMPIYEIACILAFCILYFYIKIGPLPATHLVYGEVGKKGGVGGRSIGPIRISSTQFYFKTFLFAKGANKCLAKFYLS
jgi:hypothetical protein